MWARREYTESMMTTRKPINFALKAEYDHRVRLATAARDTYRKLCESGTADEVAIAREHAARAARRESAAYGAAKAVA